MSPTAGRQLTADHLKLRPLETEDAPAIQRLASDWEVARWVERVPHPYPDGEAEKFIEHAQDRLRRGTGFAFAIIERESGELVGTVDLILEGRPAGEGEIGYWIGRDYQGRGYATLSARCLLAFAIDELGLERIVAGVLQGNEASVSVLQKCGMRLKGRRQGPTDGFDEPVISERYAVLAKDIRRN